MIQNPKTARALYDKLVALYPRAFREQFGESMRQTFADLWLEQQRQSPSATLGFITWMFAETAASIVKEHVLLLTRGGTMQDSLANDKTDVSTIQKWGGFASFVLAVCFVVPAFIYLVGNLRDALGPFTYNIADFLYGPVWAASLVTAVYALRERIGALAPRRMNLALLAALLAAAAMIAVACIRSANRQYHLNHPELHLEESTTVLVVWATLVAGVIATGWHLLGWSFLLIGSAGWTTRRLPRVLSVLYLVGGTVALLVYLLPDLEGLAGILGIVISIWQGILLLKAEPGARQAPERNTGKPLQA